MKVKSFKYFCFGCIFFKLKIVIDEKQGLETVPIKAKAKKKKIKRRRLKNSLPCNINKVYIMKLGTLSKKEYKQQCKSTRTYGS